MSRTRRSFTIGAATVFLLFTCLLAAAVFYGCGENVVVNHRAPDAPVIVGMDSGARSPEMEHKRRNYERDALKDTEWTGPLSSRLNIRAEASTWAELVAKVKPTFAWGHPETAQYFHDAGFPDMMWVEQGASGEPVFSLARAFAWNPGGSDNGDETARWVLLDFPPIKPHGENPGADEFGKGEPLVYRAHWYSESLEMPVRLHVTSDRPDGAYCFSYVSHYNSKI